MTIIICSAKCKHVKDKICTLPEIELSDEILYMYDYVRHCLNEESGVKP